MTFADTEHGTFAGLGHAVSDSDTGTDLTLLTGEAVSVTITGCAAAVRAARGSCGANLAVSSPLATSKPILQPVCTVF